MRRLQKRPIGPAVKVTVSVKRPGRSGSLAPRRGLCVGSFAFPVPQAPSLDTQKLIQKLRTKPNKLNYFTCCTLLLRRLQKRPIGPAGKVTVSVKRPARSGGLAPKRGLCVRSFAFPVPQAPSLDTQKLRKITPRPLFDMISTQINIKNPTKPMELLELPEIRQN